MHKVLAMHSKDKWPVHNLARSASYWDGLAINNITFYRSRRAEDLL